MSREVFLDTSYLVAAINARDALHEKARRAYAALELGTRFVTTEAVLTEFLAFTAGDPELRRRGLQVLDGLRNMPRCRVFHFGHTGFEAALRLYRARPDKGFSLVDCHSMILMKERRMTAALSSDEHFEQAGFTCLLPTGGRR